MLLVYTGDGKGKTSASTGQAIRAIGQGLRVAFGQFMKSPGMAGEQKVLESLLKDNFLTSGEGFFLHEKDRPKHRRAAEKLLGWAEKKLVDLDMLVLDETLYALGSELVSREEVEKLIDLSIAANCHLVLSGRGAPDWLIERADIVTEMVERKHHFAAGNKAAKGIEF